MVPMVRKVISCRSIFVIAVLFIAAVSFFPSPAEAARRKSLQTGKDVKGQTVSILSHGSTVREGEEAATPEKQAGKPPLRLSRPTVHLLL